MMIEQVNKNNNKQDEIPTTKVSSTMEQLPDDVLASILVFLSPKELEANVRHTSKALREIGESNFVWKELCRRTGKLQDESLPQFHHHESKKNNRQLFQLPKNKFISPCSCPSITTTTCYRSHYFRIPCVPVDFKTLNKALESCHDNNNKQQQQDGTTTTILLMPGIYQERIEISTSVNIRAAFPSQGATIKWDFGLNEPCFHIDGTTNNNNNNNNIHPSHYNSTNKSRKKMDETVEVTLSHVALWHSSAGMNIWKGNCAIHVEGLYANLSLYSCSIQSESGRGIVVLDGAFVRLERCIVSDCAATGLYVGDSGTVSIVSASNILRNGNGSRRQARFRRRDGTLPPIEMASVPSGHSGVYIENAAAVVENCLVAGNSLAGISVVRRGTARISDCDITENRGGEPVLTQDHFDAGMIHFDNGGANQQQQDVGRRSLGGVLFGPLPSNYLRLEDSLSSVSGRSEESIVMGGNEYEKSPTFVFGGTFRTTGTPYDQQFMDSLSS